MGSCWGRWLTGPLLGWGVDSGTARVPAWVAELDACVMVE